MKTRTLLKIQPWSFLDSATSTSLKVATKDVLAGLTPREAKVLVCVYRYEYRPHS